MATITTAATSHFSGTTPTHCSPVSRFFHSGSKTRRSNLFLIRTLNSRQVKRSFSVKNVSSEPKQKLKNPVTDEGACVFTFFCYDFF